MRSLSRIFRLSAHLAAVLLLIGCSQSYAETRQEHIQQMAHRVMPFDLSKTVHVFKMTETGGIQRVIAQDPGETDQVDLIRRHLRHEAERFRRGDYSDPAALHGAGMPGLKELEAGASGIEVSYAELPAGAEIIFTTNDLRLLTAIHRWFGAQLSEHGADAKAE